MSYSYRTTNDMLPIARGFTVYGSDYCPFCRKAYQKLEKLEKMYDVPFKKVDLETLEGNLAGVLDYFRKNQDRHQFDPNHKTRPVVFLNGIFVGGFSELENLLSQVDEIRL